MLVTVTFISRSLYGNLALKTRQVYKDYGSGVIHFGFFFHRRLYGSALPVCPDD
jgi:hypothetical protein